MDRLKPPTRSAVRATPARSLLSTRLLQLLDRNKLSELDIEAQLRCPQHLLQQCLQHLCALGKIHLTGRHRLAPATKWYGVYAGGPPPTPDDPLDYPCAFHFTHWPPGGATRDPLVAALFGHAKGAPELAPALLSR